MKFVKTIDPETGIEYATDALGKIKVSDNDTTYNYIENKIQGSGVVVSVKNEGENEYLEIKGFGDTLNRETLTMDKVLNSSSETYQYLDPNNTNRLVYLPTSVGEGKRFVIHNYGSNNYITVKLSLTEIEIISPLETKEFIYDGSNWQGLSNKTKKENISLGLFSEVLQSGIAIGSHATTRGGGIAIGAYAGANSSSFAYNIAIGGGSDYGGSSEKSSKAACVAALTSENTSLVNGIAIGHDSYSQGDYSIAIGANAKALADRSIAIGGSVSRPKRYGEDKHGIGYYQIDDDRSVSRFYLRAKTSTPGPTEMFLEGRSNKRITLTNDNVATFFIEVTAIGQHIIFGSRRFYGATMKGLIGKDNSGNIAFINNVENSSDTYIKSSWKNTNSDWATANSYLTTDNDALTIMIAGSTSFNVKWAAHVILTEILDTPDEVQETT